MPEMPVNGCLRFWSAAKASPLFPTPGRRSCPIPATGWWNRLCKRATASFPYPDRLRRSPPSPPQACRQTVSSLPAFFRRSRRRGKTGWSSIEGRPDVGWFVGSVEKDGDVSTFACVITDNGKGSDAFRLARRRLSEQLLGDLGLWRPAAG